MQIFTKVCLFFILFASTVINIQYSSDPPSGSTGAPGEGSCQQAGCHSGGSYTGSVAISGVPTDVVANTTYTITLTNTSNAVRAGFQLVCLDAGNLKCGDLTAGTGTSIELSSGKQYIRHSPAKTMSGGKASWTFDWKAPATLTNANKTVTFYYISLGANANGSDTGDNAFKSTTTAAFKSGVGTKDVSDAIAVNVFPNPAKDFLVIELKDNANVVLTLTDINGRMLLKNNLTENVSKINIAFLSAGLYNAQVQSGDKIVSKKIVIR